MAEDVDDEKRKSVAEEDEDGPVLVRRPRVRGGFVVESDDDE
jgi:replication fork protection complex subunit Tof1/Swi1